MPLTSERKKLLLSEPDFVSKSLDSNNRLHDGDRYIHCRRLSCQKPVAPSATRRPRPPPASARPFTVESSTFPGTPGRLRRPGRWLAKRASGRNSAPTPRQSLTSSIGAAQRVGDSAGHRLLLPDGGVRDRRVGQPDVLAAMTGLRTAGSTMPSIADLSDDDITHLIAYLTYMRSHKLGAADDRAR